MDDATKKDMILRDFLAVDRTKLANQRTFLSMLRTGLYFEVMGLSVLSLEALKELHPFAPVLFGIGGLFIVIGLWNYRRNDRKIDEMYREKRP